MVDTKKESSLLKLVQTLILLLSLWIGFLDSWFFQDLLSSQKGNQEGWVLVTKTFPWNEFQLQSLVVREDGFLEIQEKNTPKPIFSWKAHGKEEWFYGPIHQKSFPTSQIPGLGNMFLTRPYTLVIDFASHPIKEKLILLQKSIWTKGTEYGIQLEVYQERVQIHFLKFFLDKDNQYRSETLVSGLKVTPNIRHQLALVFLPQERKIQLYLDNSYAGGIQIQNLPYVGMGFHPEDTTPWVLGKDFYGKIFHFAVYEGIPNRNSISLPYPEVSYNSNSKTPTLFRAEAYSQVYRTTSSHTFLDSAIPSLPTQNQGEYAIYIRTSFYPFSPRKTEWELPWIPIERFLQSPRCNKNRDSSLNNQNCFYYYQWKVLARPTPDGKDSPRIPPITAKFMGSQPPKPIDRIFISENSDPENLKVCLRWNGNQEERVWNGGSYTIHYGYLPDQLEGMVRIPVQERKKEYEFCLDNQTIRKESESYLYERQMPFFHKGSTVFFRVSVENYFFQEDGPGRDQRSELSPILSYSFPF